MKIHLLLLIILAHFSQMTWAQSSEKIHITGFARLLEDEIFLPDAVISLDVFNWSGDTANKPEKLYSKVVRANESGFFSTYVKSGQWFRLSLNSGRPPNVQEAMKVWMQHALPSLKWYSKETLQVLLFLNPDNEGLLNYIAIDSGLMLADRDYVGRNREISFQVPLVITANVFKQLGWAIYGEFQRSDTCQLVVTALSPKESGSTCPEAIGYQLERAAFNEQCPTYHYQPEVQNLFDCPHGASGVTFSSEPESKMTHYFAINNNCKTDFLVSGLTETTRDGGAFLANLTPPDDGTVGVIRGVQNRTELRANYFLCEPGKVINISPPNGPAGLRVETAYTPSGSGFDSTVLLGILGFAADILFSPFSTADNTTGHSEKE